MSNFLLSENVIITGTSAALNSTEYSAHPYNAVLRQVTITTGGVGSTQTTAWMASSTATTSSSGLPSTGFITFKSENTGAIFLSVAPPGAGGATYYPGTGGHTSSGGLTNGFSTGPFFLYPFPLANDRLIVTTTDGVAASNGFCHTIRLVFEGSRY